MVKLTKRKGFNFFRSYYDVYNELGNDKDKVAFIDALFDRQFLGVKPINLKGMAKFAYISQTNSIDTQVKGYEDRMIGINKSVSNYDPWQGVEKTILTPPQQEEEEVQEKEEEKEKGKVQEKDKTLMSEIKISDVEEGLKEYFEIAEAFRKLFKKNIEEAGGSLNHIENAKFKSYVDPIRLLITSDGATKESLIKIFQYLNSQEGNFWKSNIQSTSKLREQYNTLIIKIKNSNVTSTETNQQIFDRVMASKTANDISFS